MRGSRLSLGLSPAFTFVSTMGVVNLFADMTYEGGGSINGQVLDALGAGAATVSTAAGVGEFLGYALRSAAGYAADKSGRYWLITFVGYAINLLAVPAMALAGNWGAAVALILAERIGRAMRKPTVEGHARVRPLLRWIAGWPWGASHQACSTTNRNSRLCSSPRSRSSRRCRCSCWRRRLGSSRGA